ncbi:MAG: protein kinase [Polyangiaceae bacterium]|nr:protein kinase [Polyangiaceae bacterium]
MTTDPHLGALLAMGVGLGDVLAGKYRLEKVLGAGGMGLVAAAHHLDLDTSVAIKLLLPGALSEGEAIGRFTREAQAAAKIRSEHVARVTDAGRLPNGAPYIVMEYLDGTDLGAWLAKRGALPVEQAIEFVLQACEAIAEAHGLGIVHRDLKPANLFCIQKPDGSLSIKVLDFGISKVAGPAPAGLDLVATQSACLLGSPRYSSPEQLQSARSVDARTDIWSLGVILYELLTASAPFGGEGLAELFTNITSRPAPSLHEVQPGLPPGLDQVVQKCLAKDRAKRYSNVAELAVDLLPFAPRHARTLVEGIAAIVQRAHPGTSGVSVRAPAQTASQPPVSETAASWGHTAHPTTTHRRGLVLVLASAGVLAVVALIAFAVLSKSGPAPLPAASRALPEGSSPSGAPTSRGAPASAGTDTPVVRPTQSSSPHAAPAKPVESARVLPVESKPASGAAAPSSTTPASTTTGRATTQHRTTGRNSGAAAPERPRPAPTTTTPASPSRPPDKDSVYGVWD